MSATPEEPAGPGWWVCEHCDAVLRAVPLAPGTVAECPRCGNPLARASALTLPDALPLALAGAILFALANLFPIIGLELAGERRVVPLWGAIVATWQAGEPLVALLAGATMWAFPAVFLGLHLYLLVPLSLRRRPPAPVAAMHLLRWTRPWSMVEVFLISVLVTLVKLGSFAVVIVGPGLAAIVALALLLIRLGTLELQPLWNRVLEGSPG